MTIWRITKVPIRQNANMCIDSMRQILFSIHGYRREQIALEVLFYHEQGEEILIYFVLRNGNSDIVSFIDMQLKTANYQYEKLNLSETHKLQQQISQISAIETNMVAKTEKMVTTMSVQEGYYYWVDPLLAKDGEDNNFVSLFQMLQNCSNSFVLFEVMPTYLENYEQESLSYLDMILGPRVNVGINNTAGFGYEPYALPAYQAYHHCIENRNKPFFTYNMIIGSASGNGSLLSNQLISILKAHSVNAPDFQIINVCPVCYTESAFPYAMTNLIMKQYRDMVIWGGNMVAPNTLFRYPYIMTIEEVLTFFHMPIDDGDIVGISGSVHQRSNELLDKHVTDTNNILFGTLMGESNVWIGASTKDFAKHAVIVGMPGTGKTTFSLNLLLQFYKKGIPFLAVEPTKSEYRALLNAIPDLQIFTPGNKEISPFVLNPFIPPKGIPIIKYIPSLFSAFQAAFSMPSPLDSAFLKAIRMAYTKYGWRDYSQAGDADVTPFGMHEFIMVFKDMIQNMNYGKDVKGNLQSAGALRLANIIDQNKDIFDTIHTIPIEDLLKKPTVIELNAIDNMEQKSLIMAILLINISVYIKNNQTEGATLQNVILMDEAHVLLDANGRNDSGDSKNENFAAKLIVNLIAEIRAYGTSIIIADQRPSMLGSPIIANTDIKIMFRLTDKREKELIGNSTDMDDNMQRQLSNLEMRQAFVYYHRLLQPQLVITPDIRKNNKIRLTVKDSEVKEKNNYWKNRGYLLKPHLYCKFCRTPEGQCNYRIKADAEYFANLVLDNVGDKIEDVPMLITKCNSIPFYLKSKLVQYEDGTKDALIICIRIAFLRKVEMEKGLRLPIRYCDLLLSSPEVRHN